MAALRSGGNRQTEKIPRGTGKQTEASVSSQADPFKPTVTCLVKLGSIAVHVDEMLSPMGHGFDKIAIQQLLNDKEVVTWIAAMHKMAMLPVKRP